MFQSQLVKAFCFAAITVLIILGSISLPKDLSESISILIGLVVGTATLPLPWAWLISPLLRQLRLSIVPTPLLWCTDLEIIHRHDYCIINGVYG